MSTTTAVPNNSMRQQLDELDSLLQRMLSLPINQLDENQPAASPRAAAPVAAAPQVTFVPPPPKPTAQPAEGWRPPAMVLLADSGPVQPPAAPESSFDRSWSINLNPQFGSSVLGPAPAPAPVAPARPTAPVPAPTPSSLHIEPIPQPVVRASVPIPEPVTAYTPRRDEPPPPLLAPLVAFNQLFDAIVGLFGPLGRCVCGPVGRNILGMAGVLMFLGGIAWGLMEYNGWSW
ncbi:MAG: hypothetical protein U0746_12845 [Gemmataceae bacterium]